MEPTSSAIGFTVIVALYITIGVMSAAGSVYISKSIFSAKVEQIFFGLFLIPIAGFYLAFTAHFGDKDAWQLESTAVAVFAVFGPEETRGGRAHGPPAGRGDQGGQDPVVVEADEQPPGGQVGEEGRTGPGQEVVPHPGSTYNPVAWRASSSWTGTRHPANRSSGPSPARGSTWSPPAIPRPAGRPSPPSRPASSCWAGASPARTPRS